ncbi:MAG: recombinase family protein [Gemella haemolysans]|uniref:recombinase family protein n=1 Tax=Gemella haemolysans TaxID=1379 RepID=UPI003FA07F07
MKRVALYMRVSTQEQAENGNSLEFQKEKLEAYCKLHEYKIVGEYVDAGVSGAKFNRPALDRLKDDVEKIDIVLIYKLDRLSRSIKDTMLLIEDFFKPNKIDLISLSENFDTTQAIGMATVGMLSTFAQLERDTIKQRMMAGKVQSVKNGNYINNAPFGYVKKDGKLVKDEKTKECVEYIFERLLDGDSTTRIANLLEENGFASLRKGLWHFMSINRIAKNDVYAGHTTLMKTQVKNTHEPYITDEEQNRIIRMLEIRNLCSSKNRKDSFTSPYRGLINCPACHRKLACNRQVRKKTTTHSYRCIYCKRINDVTRQINSKRIDKALIEYFENLDFSLNFTEEKKKTLKPVDFRKEYIKLENKRKKLQKAWFNELLTDEELKKHQDSIQRKYDELKEEENKILIFKENNNMQNKIKNISLNFSELIHNLSVEEKTSFLNSFIESIDIEFNNIRDLSTENIKRIKADIVVTHIDFKS